MASGDRHSVKLRSINGFHPVKKLFGHTPSDIDKVLNLAHIYFAYRDAFLAGTHHLFCCFYQCLLRQRLCRSGACCLYVSQMLFCSNGLTMHSNFSQQHVAIPSNLSDNPSFFVVSFQSDDTSQRPSLSMDSCSPPTPEPDLNSLCCRICASCEDDNRMLLCDGCDAGYHMYCLRPILVAVPAGDWFCLQCVPAEKVPGTQSSRSHSLCTVTYVITLLIKFVFIMRLTK